MQSAWTATPVGARCANAMRSRPGERAPSSSQGRSGGAAAYGSPGSGPAIASSIAALSRTLRDTTCWIASPLRPSPPSGPAVMRARVGFRPNRPQAEAGMRIEPPPSVAWATVAQLDRELRAVVRRHRDDEVEVDDAATVDLQEA